MRKHLTKSCIAVTLITVTLILHLPSWGSQNCAMAGGKAQMQASMACCVPTRCEDSGSQIARSCCCNFTNGDTGLPMASVGLVLEQQSGKLQKESILSQKQVNFTPACKVLTRSYQLFDFHPKVTSKHSLNDLLSSYLI